jgi:hypothetical protein
LPHPPSAEDHRSITPSSKNGPDIAIPISTSLTRHFMPLLIKKNQFSIEEELILLDSRERKIEYQSMERLPKRPYLKISIDLQRKAIWEKTNLLKENISLPTYQRKEILKLTKTNKQRNISLKKP